MKTAILTAISSVFFLSACIAGSAPMNDSTLVVFFGDSITQLGVDPGGYIALMADSLSHTHSAVRLVGAGVSGNKVPDLDERLERDVLSRKPDIVFISIGINDVWRHWRCEVGL